MRDPRPTEADGGKGVDIASLHDLPKKLRAAELDAVGVPIVAISEILGLSTGHLSRLRNQDREYISHRDQISADIMGKVSDTAAYGMTKAMAALIRLLDDESCDAQTKMEAAKALLSAKVPLVSEESVGRLSEVFDYVKGIKK